MPLVLVILVTMQIRDTHTHIIILNLYNIIIMICTSFYVYFYNVKI